ncbi:MAG: hypothetical protein ACFCVG_05980 [Kineosporiaceae bacterium]
MIFLFVLVVATAASALVRRRAGLRTHARWGLAIAMVVAGISHFLQPEPFRQHLPDAVPARDVVVAVSGAVEIGLGLGLVVLRRYRRRAGWALAAFLVAVFPANVYVAAAGIDVEGQPGGIYPWVRLPLQALFIAWALWSTAASPAPGVREPDVPERAT